MRVDVEESLLVGAPPEKVYKVLAQPEHHKHILPDIFVRYEAESDDIVSFSIKYYGAVRDMRAKVVQIEPDRVLHEIDLATDIVTAFRLEPHKDGTVVTLAVHYEANKSIAGFIEALMVPPFLRRLYKEELVKLGRYVLLVD